MILGGHLKKKKKNRRGSRIAIVVKIFDTVPLTFFHLLGTKETNIFSVVCPALFSYKDGEQKKRGGIKELSMLGNGLGPWRSMVISC